MIKSWIIPPVIALVAAGILIARQRQTIATFENESVLLQRHIASDRFVNRGDETHSQMARSAMIVSDKESLDWKKIAIQFAGMEQSGRASRVRAGMKLEQRFQAMTSQELATALDEILSLELAHESRNIIGIKLIEALVEKDPECALTRFIDLLPWEPGLQPCSDFVNALQKWASKDPAKATAWFNQQNAAGKFDSKTLSGEGDARNLFGGALIGVLLASDPEAASRQLGTAAADQRGDILMKHSSPELLQETPLAFATLVREQVPAEDQGKTLGGLASGLSGKDGYAKINDFMNRIAATPAERKTCVERAANAMVRWLSYRKKITLEDLDAMREWTNSHTPESTDRITGKALAHAAENRFGMDFDAASELALHYHEASGNDDVLVEFLNHATPPRRKNEASGNDNGLGLALTGTPPRTDKDKLRSLAEKITDLERRKEFLKKLESPAP